MYETLKDNITELICHTVVNSSLSYEEAWTMTSKELNVISEHIKSKIELELKMLGAKI